MIGVGRTIVPYSPPKSYKGAPIYREGRFILCAIFEFYTMIGVGRTIAPYSPPNIYRGGPVYI